MADRETKGGYVFGDVPASEPLGAFPEVLTRPALHCSVTAVAADGEPCEVTVGEAEGAITYNEYWTGPSPWWKRALRLLRR